jgi:cell division protein FtsL
MKTNSKIKFFSSRIFIIMGVCAIALIGFSLAKETYRNYQIQKEIQTLEKEISRLENDNENLANLIKYFETEAYQEREARQKLGLQKEGEKVVIITEEEIESQETIQESNEPEEEIAEEEISNLRKWWNFIFVWKE